MNGRLFSKSLSLLIVAVLIITAFFREPKHQWLYIAVFAVWAAVLLLRSLAGRIAGLGRILRKTAQGIDAARRTAKLKQKKALAETTLTARSDSSDDKLLLGHLNCRITDKLRAVFPDATWRWQEKTPELIARGGTGRIRIEDAGEYTHADVTVDSFFRISFAMMKIISLQETAEDAARPETDTADAREPVQANVADWYDWVGKEALQDVITELNSRGYSRVFVKETGEVYVVEDGDEAVKATLKEMPGKSKWTELVDVLAAGDLRGEIDNDRLAVAWA
jgi:hypothetical protein